MALETLAGKGDSRWNEISDSVKQIVAEQLGKNKDAIQYESRFVEDLNADSLDTIELIMRFEDKHNIKIPEKDTEKITTVRQAVDYIFEAKYNSQ